jgi:DNA polymerase-3 subunit epsilon
MLIYDTETTGLPKHPSAPLASQPEIIEFAALRLDDETLEEKAALSFLLKPRILPLDAKITEITGLVDADLADAPSFARKLPEISAFFLGEETVVGHYLAFDISLLHFELRRLDRVTKFPWPPTQVCTVETNMDLLGRRLKQDELYKLATGREPVGAHRALNDVRNLAEIVRWMRQNSRF